MVSGQEVMRSAAAKAGQCSQCLTRESGVSEADVALKLLLQSAKAMS